MRIVNWIFLSTLLLLSTLASSQDFKIKGYAGAVRYFGDLAPYSFINTTSEAHITLGFSVGVEITDYLSVNIKYLTGKLSGNDSESSVLERRFRNLRFESPLNEIGLITELNISNLFWKGVSKYGIQAYLSTGINAFHFNPRTDYKGNIYFLQPLSTEGQGIDNIDEYKLNQINIPYGFGIEFRLSENLNMGLEVTSRITFTDYIDDVSGVYPDFQKLGLEKGEIALALSNRAGELPGNSIPKSGDLRGNPDNNDFFVFTGIYLAYYIGNNPITIKNPLDAEEEGSLIFPSNN